MAYSRSEVFGRAAHFATKTGRVLEEELGFGVHGMVWSTDQKSVIKVHGSERLYYERERDIYLRLREHDVRKVLEFHVPSEWMSVPDRDPHLAEQIAKQNHHKPVRCYDRGRLRAFARGRKADADRTPSSVVGVHWSAGKEPLRLPKKQAVACDGERAAHGLCKFT